MKNHDLNKRAHSFMDVVSVIAKDTVDVLSDENPLDLFSTILNSKSLKLLTTTVDDNYISPPMREDSKLLLAQAIVQDQCLILTQQTNHLLLMSLKLKNGVLNPNKNALDGSLMPKKTLGKILKNKSMSLLGGHPARKIAVHKKNYQRKTIGAARLLDEDTNMHLTLYVPTTGLSTTIEDKSVKHDADFAFQQMLTKNSKELEKTKEAIDDFSDTIENIEDDEELFGLSQHYWNILWSLVEGSETFSLGSLLVLVFLLKKHITKLEMQNKEQQIQLDKIERKLDQLNQARFDETFEKARRTS